MLVYREQILLERSPFPKMYEIDENQCSSELSPFDVRNHFSSLATPVLYSVADLEGDIRPNRK